MIVTFKEISLWWLLVNHFPIHSNLYLEAIWKPLYLLLILKAIAADLTFAKTRQIFRLSNISDFSQFLESICCNSINPGIFTTLGIRFILISTLKLLNSLPMCVTGNSAKILSVKYKTFLAFGRKQLQNMQDSWCLKSPEHIRKELYYFHRISLPYFQACILN